MSTQLKSVPPTSGPHSPRLRRRVARGFSITEVALAIIVFGMMSVLFAAVFPMTVRGAQYSGNYSQAAMLAQHKMDQLRSAGFNSLDFGHLSGVGAVDNPQPTGYPISANGSTTYSFTTVDALINGGGTQGYFAPGSKGTVTVVDYALLHPGVGIPAGTMAYVTVQITWTGGGTADGSYSTSAIIANA